MPGQGEKEEFVPAVLLPAAEKRPVTAGEIGFNCEYLHGFRVTGAILIFLFTVLLLKWVTL